MALTHENQCKRVSEQSVCVHEPDGDDDATISPCVLRRVLISLLLLGYVTLPLWMMWIDANTRYGQQVHWERQATMFYVPVTATILVVSAALGMIGHKVGRKELGGKAFCTLNAFAIIGTMMGLCFLPW